jgi:hypothetical protein
MQDEDVLQVDLPPPGGDAEQEGASDQITAGAIALDRPSSPPPAHDPDGSGGGDGGSCRVELPDGCVTFGGCFWR